MEPLQVISMSRFIFGALAALLLAGCQTARPLYYWGHYEPLSYQSYVAPEKATAQLQIEKLKEDLEKAKAANLTPHPGLHAHLGYLYAQTGRMDLAQAEFVTEKTLFPESAVFMDRMLKQPIAPAPAAPAPADRASPPAAVPTPAATAKP